MVQRARRALGATAILGTAFLVATVAPVALAAETCVQTRVSESFVSPDGRVRGPGVVKVCPYWSVSPSLRLNSVSFNGVKLGIWMTRAGEAGKFADSAKLTLRRLPEGRIALADYYWPGRDGRPMAPGLRAANAQGDAAAASTPLGP